MAEEKTAGQTPKRKKRWPKVLIVIGSLLLALVLAALVVLGGWGYFGPLKGLSVTRIQLKYPGTPTGNVVFYGASNFTMWGELEEDMLPFVAQNHGFGGSADDDLMRHAEKLLYPYEPSIVVFQSGSNDFVLGMTVDEVCANKDKMYAAFRERLPGVPFVVMSMLPLPQRAEYWPQSHEVNQYLQQYCESHEDMLFVDATDVMMTPEGGFRPEYYRDDGIHLNRDGQLVWGEQIKRALEEATQML